MNLAQAKETAEKARPLLAARNQVLAYLYAAEKFIKEHNDYDEGTEIVYYGDEEPEFAPPKEQMWKGFSEADYKKFLGAVHTIREALLGKKDEFGILVKHPTPIVVMPALEKGFKDTVSSLPDRLKDHFNGMVDDKDKEAKLEKAVDNYENFLLSGNPTKSKPADLRPEAPKWETLPYEKPKEQKGNPIEDTTKWPTIKDKPGIKRVPTRGNTDQNEKVVASISEMASMPSGKSRRPLGEKIDAVVTLLDKNPSEEQFLEEAHAVLGSYYHVEPIDKRIKEVKEDISRESTDSLKHTLSLLEDHHNDITKMDGNLKFLYQNWTPMETKSNLVKDIKGNKVILGDRRITLTTPDMIVASIKFASLQEACEKFFNLNTAEDMESAFSLSSLIAMERVATDVGESAPDNTGVKGPNTTEEKEISEETADWIHSANLDNLHGGNEEEITKKVEAYLKDKYPTYTEDAISREARKAYANYVATRKPLLNEVGAVGKNDMRAEEVFTEPSRGGNNVQNLSPTNVVRKKALLSFRTEMGGTVKVAHFEVESSEAPCKNFTADPASPQYCLTCKWIKDQHPQFKKKESSLRIVAFVAHMPGHKNAQGEAAPWVIKSHETDKILSSHATEAKAKEHLQQMHMFKSMGKEAGADLSQVKPAILDPKTGEIFTGENHANAFDNAMKSDAPIEVKRRAMQSLELENENTGFKDVDGKFITRAEAKEKYGFATSEQLADKMNKGASMNAGDIAILNTQVGMLPEGTEVEVTTSSETEVAFVAGDMLGVTKLANLDKVEKYLWDNDGLTYKFCLGDRVKVGSIEHNGESWKGEEGIIREKVVLATNGEAECFYLVELDCGGNETLPEEMLSKAGKKKEAALNHAEFIKEAAHPADEQCAREGCSHTIYKHENHYGNIGKCNFTVSKGMDKEDHCKCPGFKRAMEKVAVVKPNIDAVQEFLKSYEHPPTVVTTDDIEEWMSDEKQNYQYSKKDLKEFVKYLEGAHVEVRVPAKKKTPEVLPEEAGEMMNAEKPEALEAAEAKEFAPPKELLKEAVKYKYMSPDGKQTIEKDVTDDMGAEFETDNPTTPGQKMKWTKSNLVVECAECSGVGSNPCTCMDDELWLTASCKKCNDEGAVPCSACKAK